MTHLLAALALLVTGTATPSSGYSAPFRGMLIRADQLDEKRIAFCREMGATAIALAIDEDLAPDALRQSIDRTKKAGLELYYWIEVGRNPKLADAHPEWMASLQGHPEWRRLFPKAPLPAAGEVVKNYPWVPIGYKEAYAAHLLRIKALIGGLPKPSGIFLNDLQGAPSACGCGNSLCRWTTDYGPISTASRLGDDAPARFAAEVKKLTGCEVIPVWTTECEKHDGAKDGACAGVGCFEGTCWRAYTSQLMPVAEQAPRMGVLCTYKELKRDLPIYGSAAGWVKAALDSFTIMPPLRSGKPIPAARLIAVLQDWNVAREEIIAEIKQAKESGVGGMLFAFSPIEQGWEPRIVKIK